jgi:heme exporter protein A
MPKKTSLAANAISCQRGGRVLFEGLSFALEPGESLLVTGPNGAGKTSLLRLIAGLKSALNLGENVSFWVDFLGGDGSGVQSAYRMFGLAELKDLPAGLLSAGQKRKLALLRLFAAPRPIWLLDEPSVSLDVASVKVLDKAIAQHLAQGGIAVVASHVTLKVKFAHELALKLEPLT